MTEVATMPVVIETPMDQAENGLAAEIIEEVTAKLNLDITEKATPAEETAEKLEEPVAEAEKIDDETELKPPETEDAKKGDTINSSSSSAKDDITDSSEAKVNEKDSADTKKQKSLIKRFRSWWTTMFAVKGEQPSTVTKVVGNLRNSLRRKNTGSKKDKKAKSEEISEETSEQTEKAKLETCEKDSNIGESKDVESAEKPVESVEEKAPVTEVVEGEEKVVEETAEESAVVEEKVVESATEKVVAVEKTE